MELLNNKFEVTFVNNASLRNAPWTSAKQAKEYRIKFNETGNHCFVVIYGGSTAKLDEKDALYCLLDDAVTYKDGKDYGDISQYLIDEFGYDEYTEDAYGRLRKNPKLGRVERGLLKSYEKVCDILHGKAKILDLLDEFREEYDY